MRNIEIILQDSGVIDKVIEQTADSFIRDPASEKPAGSIDPVPLEIRDGKIVDAFSAIGGTAGKVLGTVSSIFGSLFGGPGGGFAGGLGKLFGFAGGGAIQPRLPAIVGERGPELFIPNSGGRIVNGANTRGMLAAQPINITQNNTFTTDVRNSVRAEIANAAPALVEASKRAVADAAIRGGNSGAIFR
ncbi:MAG: hypothetical protein ACE5EM_10200 [Sphingomonadales bacterium]